MQIKPVTKANIPEYPTASEIDIPKVLNASKPKKWKRNAAIGAVMVGMIGSVNSCKYIHTDKKESYPLDSIALIAPLFKHGDGVGAFGCIVVAPPVFLSESQMLDVVESELEDLDMSINKNYNDSQYVSITSKRPKKDFRSFSTNSIERYEDTLVTKQIPYDLLIDSSNIGIIIISENKYKNYGDKTYGSTVECIAPSNLASNILKNNKNFNKSFVLFYDPAEKKALERDEENQLFPTSKSTIENKSKEKLREQVRDFVKWFEANKYKKIRK